MFLGDPSLCADRGFIETVLKAEPLGTSRVTAELHSRPVPQRLRDAICARD
jgi:hypothetical protein